VAGTAVTVDAAMPRVRALLAMLQRPLAAAGNASKLLNSLM